MRILLCYTGGLSTNTLIQDMKKVVKGSVKLNEEDLKFTVIPADSLEEEIDNWDMVLVRPQAPHKVNLIEAVCKPKNMSSAVIDRDVYGQMNGVTVLKLALVTRKKHEIGKQSLIRSYKRLCFIYGQPCIVQPSCRMNEQGVYFQECPLTRPVKIA